MYSLAINNEIIKEKLSEDLYNKYLYYRNNYLPFDEELLNKYTLILKDFAFQNNCTHYALLFYPLDNKIAYKQLSFYKRNKNKIEYDLDVSDLLNSEVDGSSFENGGLRNICNAKGLISIDTNANPFIYQKVLYIPAVYKSLNNDNLDNKIPLLNSIKELNKITKKVYNYLGNNYKYITPYLGLEQEFYLLKKSKTQEIKR